MELTEEQRERARRNREKALAIQKQKREERALIAQESDESKKRSTNLIEFTDQDRKRSKIPSQSNESLSKAESFTLGQKHVVNENVQNEDETTTNLEEFEIGASPYVTKKEAMSMYCLPEGTIAVCKCTVEKANPLNRQWKPMKLYSRSEVRRRAYKRYGGQAGLIEERQRRQQKQYERNVVAAENIFK